MEKNNEEKKYRWINILQKLLLFVLTAAVSGIAAFAYGKTVIEIAGLAILASAGFGGVLFAIEQSYETQSFLFDNQEHFWRVTLIYFIGLGGSVLFPLLPVAGWPYLAVFVALMLFSNQVIALSAGSVLVMISVFLQGSASSVFFVYFISGLVGLVVFSYINETFKVWLPTLISLLALMVCLSIQEVLFANEALNAQMFIVPTVNILVSLILLLIILKFFSVSIIYKNRDMYMDINDPECPLLVELKAMSKDEYYHAVHTAYLCDRIAKKLKLDDALVKACGYYHKIGILKGENTWENVQDILQEYQFPIGVQSVLKEYIHKEQRIVSKETVILLFSDTIISSITYLFSKDSQVQLDYPKLISAIFKKKLESGIIDYSNISFEEIQEMKKILVEEKLYYDFLR